MCKFYRKPLLSPTSPTLRSLFISVQTYKRSVHQPGFPIQLSSNNFSMFPVSRWSPLIPYIYCTLLGLRAPPRGSSETKEAPQLLWTGLWTTLWASMLWIPILRPVISGGLWGIASLFMGLWFEALQLFCMRVSPCCRMLGFCGRSLRNIE